MMIAADDSLLVSCDLAAATNDVRAQLEPTPLLRHPMLDDAVGSRVYVKLENATPIGAFKLRGALHLVASMGAAERARGLCAPTRGNHGQALAWAAQAVGMRCTLFVPEGNNPEKDAAMRALGAELIVSGESFDETALACEVFARGSGARLVHPGREPCLIAGAATLFLELLEQAPEPLDVLFVPVGVGSCICGAALALRGRDVTPRLIGVQSTAAPAMTHAWRDGRATRMPAGPTLADGLAVGVPVRETLGVMASHVDRMLLVDEEELRGAMRLYARSLHQLSEGAGAAALAGALQIAGELAGLAVGVVLSGGNLDTRILQHLFR